MLNTFFPLPNPGLIIVILILTSSTQGRKNAKLYEEQLGMFSLAVSKYSGRRATNFDTVSGVGKMI